MSIKNRLKKLESQIIKEDSNFCRCGTLYFAAGENIVNEVCPDCGRDVKPQTVAEFVKDAHRYECEVIKPTLESEETKTI